MKHGYACLAGLALGLLPAWAPAAGSAGVEVRAYVNDSCVIADEPFFLPEAVNDDGQRARALPLLGLVIGKATELLINYMVGRATDRVKTAGGRQDTQYGVTREMNLFRADVDPVPTVRLNSKLGCMTVVAARKFLPDDNSCTAAYVPKEIARDSMAGPESEWRTTRSDDSVENRLRRANICVDGSANAVYEARFEFSADGTAYRMQDAGYRVNSLLTAPAKGTTRSVFYTVEIATPGQKHDERDVISTAWVNIGPVDPGAHREAPAGDTGAWLRVPPLSPDARRAYEEQTRAYHELASEIDAARRALDRNGRVIVDLRQRVASAARPELAQALGQEIDKAEVRQQVLDAELSASSAQYAAQPRKTLEFMPVSIQVGITESRSEKAALLALAKVIDSAGGAAASMGGDLSAGLVNKSVDASGPQVRRPASAVVASDPATALERARAAYYDTLIAAKAATAGGGEAPAPEQLADAKLLYNRALRASGLAVIP